MSNGVCSRKCLFNHFVISRFRNSSIGWSAIVWIKWIHSLSWKALRLCHDGCWILFLSRNVLDFSTSTITLVYFFSFFLEIWLFYWVLISGSYILLFSYWIFFMSPIEFFILVLLCPFKQLDNFPFNDCCVICNCSIKAKTIDPSARGLDQNFVFLIYMGVGEK